MKMFKNHYKEVVLISIVILIMVVLFDITLRTFYKFGFDLYFSSQNFNNIFTPFLSLLGSCIVAYSISVMIKQTKNQVIQTKLQSKQIEIQIEQSKNFTISNFETLFFKLMDGYHDVVENTKGNSRYCKNGMAFYTAVFFDILSAYKSFNPRPEFLAEAFDLDVLNKYFDSQTVNRFMHDLDNFNNPPADIVNGINKDKYIKILTEDIVKCLANREIVCIYFRYIYENAPETLGYYFRYIYNFFYYTIDFCKMNGISAKKYLNIFQSQLTGTEIGLLFYYSLSDYAVDSNGEQIFYNWMNEFDFLENVDKTSLISYKLYECYDILFKFLTDNEKEERNLFFNFNKSQIPSNL